ncbi:MAG TPA: sigma-70 family RNA polymerase sigma factor [Candidatus Limnocylindrales bacterium]
MIDEPAAPTAPDAPVQDESAGPEVLDEAARRRRDDAARDQRLVQRTLAGDLDAFNELVGHYQDLLFGLTYRVVRDREVAADAVQEAFFSAFRNLDRFRGTTFRAWLSRIAINAATDVLRARKRRPADPYPEWEDDSWQPPSGPEDDPELLATRRARARAIAVAMSAITADQRRAILLFDVEGFDYQEIADITEVSLGTVKSRIHRGRLALRDLLADEMELLRDG